MPAQDHATSPPSPVTIHVCVTCRAPGADPDAERPGAVLHRRLAEALAGDPALAARIAIEPVECLSVCKRPCTVAATSPGRWTYVWGDLDAETGIAAILDGVSRYADTADGIVPWRERPEAFRKGVVARIPPLPAPGAA